MKPNQCVVLVPYSFRIEPLCEEGLRELEAIGFVVRRVPGFSAIDQGRNQLATDAMFDGFEATMWIDSDIGFSATDVQKLIAHDLPISCGLYPKKGKRSLAMNACKSDSKIVFGAKGGLLEIDFVGAGFLLIRRQVYIDVQNHFDLPVCNSVFDKGMIPFFLPEIQQEQYAAYSGATGFRYLAEDYAFCQRAKTAGYKILADTSIRLSHVGSYAYQWEDAGSNFRRYESYTYHLKGRKSDAVSITNRFFLFNSTERR